MKQIPCALLKRRTLLKTPQLATLSMLATAEEGPDRIVSSKRLGVCSANGHSFSGDFEQFIESRRERERESDIRPKFCPEVTFFPLFS